MVEFNRTTTALAFGILLIVILGGTFSSPMMSSTKAMVGAGLVVFGIVTLLLGMKFGEYRARSN